MKIIQLHIYLLMWSQVTESLTNLAVTLGADVNISCDLDIEEIYCMCSGSLVPLFALPGRNPPVYHISRVHANYGAYGTGFTY
ncbi:immunoglobulin iota chain [Labeo rohita]|nr:immunoglobulin iota chain [Labeo rohita]